MNRHSVLRALASPIAAITFVGAAVVVIGTAQLTTWSQSAPIKAVRIRVLDERPWHVHPPGRKFQLTLQRSGGGSAAVTAQWIDAEGKPLGRPVRLRPDAKRKLTAPSDAIGYYGLVFSSNDEQVAFPPQPPGFPSAVHGFAILPLPKPSDDSSGAGLESPFGVVHADVTVDGSFDPYLTGHHAKTLTWHTVGASEWHSAIRARDSAGIRELPIIADDGWDSDGHSAITAAELQGLARRFKEFAGAAPLRDWELGVEENYENRYGREPFYLPNLARKAEVVRRELREVHPNGRLIYNLEGFDYIDWDRLAASDAIKHLDVLATHPYRWTKFETPETWLGDHIDKLRAILSGHNRGNMPLWITEIGVPVRGNNDPNGFFGYPESGNQVPGVSRDYAARYLIKCHAVALAAGVERIYIYNYQNRGNDIKQAEDHFGLRAYTDDDSPGAPLPSYVAYVTMLQRLQGQQFVRVRHPDDGIWLYEFADQQRRTALIWAEPGIRLNLSLPKIFVDRSSRQSATACDLYGTPMRISSAGIAIGERPVYVTVP